MTARPHIIVVTGLSGAGRSTALRVLEDAGFFCVDNLPPGLALALIGLVDREGKLERIGLGIDVRTGAFLSGAEETLSELEALGHRVQVIFLDCADDVLVRRFSETRRPHALSRSGDLHGAISRERERLSGLRARADVVVDTTEYSVHDLRRRLIEYVGRDPGRPSMLVRLLSFGFKYGVPVDADLVFDLRFLPNPHFVDALRPKTGMDPEVSTYVMNAPETQDLLRHLRPLLDYLIPQYAREGKAYLTVAVGCTGGRHRSVAMAEELGHQLGGPHEVVVSHRDVQRTGS
ncbi:MAG: RNase adapter RapZ [Deltaproteobacteria bacterium]|nr:RNase adapter RapZ [Deltaproteobacteria bacterium]NND29575.1 RNase adapter RapZ [Myxococcales bacterium]MBT8464211.1 RNase adapter RapZ [Deltaproteobacteria bacterium]MBT8481719.1 RNase adapter RapZ [Deltaproteobacteria bacterium]NNK06045.1 RNase adapter RapZ [Myxococcales bacterium]